MGIVISELARFTFARAAVVAGVCTLLTVAARNADAQVVRETDEAGREVVRRCQPTVWPKKLPALNAVLDSAALWAELAGVPAGDSTIVLLSVVYYEGGTPTVRLLEPLPPSASAVALANLAGNGLHAVDLPQPVGAVRVRLQAWPAKTASVERSVYCPATVVPSGPIGPQTTRVVLSPGDQLPSGPKIRIDAQITIDEAGQVSAVELLGSSGIRELDEQLLTDLRRRVYRPALLDGVRVASWERSGGRKMRL